MAVRPISDELLHLTIERRLEAGVEAGKIRQLVCMFASARTHRESAEDIAGLLWVEDIPRHDRQQFLTNLRALPTRSSQKATACHGSQRPKRSFAGSVLARWHGVGAALGLIRNGAAGPPPP